MVTTDLASWSGSACLRFLAASGDIQVLGIKAVRIGAMWHGLGGGQQPWGTLSWSEGRE